MRARPGAAASQEAVIAFLEDPRTYPGHPPDVRVIETHAAMIFLAGEAAWKIKKAIVLPYLDFSTVDRRRTALERELEVNRPHAPQIYRDVVAICRTQDGALTVAGQGEPIEWVLRMNRFDQSALLSRIAERHGVSAQLADHLAATVIACHYAAPPNRAGEGRARISLIINELCDAFESASAEATIDTEAASTFQELSRRHAGVVGNRLDQRQRRGYVRRGHGDLHLDNIVVLDGTPVLFDAIEFDEDIATTDVLYDLAFLVMDLHTRGLTAAANRVLNRYIIASNDPANIAGLQAMPLFLACRAAIRSMVAFTRVRQAADPDARAAQTGRVRHYLDHAVSFLEPVRPHLVCIAGLSGSGKTTVARGLAPHVGRAPGALHLRSDVERKLMLGVAETDRLGSSAYTPELSVKVYRRLLHKARLALMAGCSVIVDAVFLKVAEGHRFEHLSKLCNASFDGFWLSADERTMRQRIVGRRGDASDATAGVLRQQVKAGAQPPQNWHIIEAEAPAPDVSQRCLEVLGM